MAETQGTAEERRRNKKTSDDFSSHEKANRVKQMAIDTTSHHLLLSFVHSCLGIVNVEQSKTTTIFDTCNAISNSVFARKKSSTTENIDLWIKRNDYSDVMFTQKKNNGMHAPEPKTNELKH